jgi:hypothetical protein
VTAASARELLLRPDYVVPHTDADGLAAGAIALRARGESAAAAVLQERSIRLAHSLARTRSRAAFCLQIEIRHAVPKPRAHVRSCWGIPLGYGFHAKQAFFRGPADREKFR